MQAHAGCNVFVHLAPIEVGNATKIDGNSSTLQKESKHVKPSSGCWLKVQGPFRRVRAHLAF